MPLRDFLKKKEKLEEHAGTGPHGPSREPLEDLPQFIIMRSDTHSQEIISPPTFSFSDTSTIYGTMTDGATESRMSNILKKRTTSTSRESVSSDSSRHSDKAKIRSQTPRRLSERLHLRRSISSSNVPDDLPEIQTAADPDAGGAGTESQWEQRATILARENEKQRSSPSSPVRGDARLEMQLGRMTVRGGESPGGKSSAVSSKYADDNIQDAIRLHEAGDLKTSTRMFGRLADPKGENNALSQVLYGLALRHGWGCDPNPTEAVVFLSAAASNAASIENLALQAGMKKGGAAKGELILAIFELANCFRHGWGVEKDPVAAQRYYETAANLGDTDAMNEVAWCYTEGFGCKKDKFAAAKYYRSAENAGSKTLGNSWIWKEKYNNPKK